MVAGCLVLHAGFAVEPSRAGTRIWKDPNGTTRMSNIETLMPAKTNAPEKAARPAPGNDRRKAGTTWRNRPLRTPDRAEQRANAAIEQLAERNRLLLELKDWFLRLTEDPELIYDTGFIAWVRSIWARTPPVEVRQTH